MLFITYLHNDTDSMVEDVSGSLTATRKWMQGRSGFVYRYERQPDGSYGNEAFIEQIGHGR